MGNSFFDITGQLCITTASNKSYLFPTGWIHEWWNNPGCWYYILQ